MTNEPQPPPNTEAPHQEVSFHRQSVNLKDLDFDLENPRFGLKEVSTTWEALQILAERANLRELWDSIRSQGWLDIEPMVCIYDEPSETYIVIEGNRRLAALKTLIRPNLLDARLQSRVPELPSSQLTSLTSIEVVVVRSRRDADAFVGFKHVNGPASWGSLAKAKFATDMFTRMKKNEHDAEVALKRVTDALGDTTTSMLRMIVGYKVLEQALEEGILSSHSTEAGGFEFSHLYTMMPNPATREYLGWGGDPLNADSIRDRPVSPAYRPNLENLVGWLFGTDTIDRVINSQGTDRPKLQKVLRDPDATGTLERTGSLEHASTAAGLHVDAWRNRLYKVELQALELVQEMTHIFDEMEDGVLQDTLKRSRKIKRNINVIIRQLEDPDEDDDEN
ncbi:ParB N-terminal domain-containing protein [Thioalkalivibrio sp. ALE20]|uniref:ParB N-terminal domain-containing protein n=1 Tax=Thioalkalivibrio sp. ALE20 TaxID=545275 RepID=UPI0012EA4301|nr:ParB N-terminal domain-containing protein [Thioalkalivibrio sp. ALE20]